MLTQGPAQAQSQGLINVRPIAAKSWTSRVARGALWASAVAAITASAVAIGLASRSRCRSTSAYQWVASLVKGQIRPLNCSATSASQLCRSCTWRQRFDLVYAEYLNSVGPELRHLLSQFRMSDCAFRAAGVGSVGTRCSIGVLVGDHPDDVLVLQSKQAKPSVQAPYVNQPSPDRNWKGAVDVSQLNTDGLKDYGKLCAWTLAKAHARSGDRRAIAVHIDEPKRYTQGVLEQAMHHAHLAEADHQTFLEANAKE